MQLIISLNTASAVDLEFKIQKIVEVCRTSRLNTASAVDLEFFNA